MDICYYCSYIGIKSFNIVTIELSLTWNIFMINFSSWISLCTPWKGNGKFMIINYRYKPVYKLQMCKLLHECRLVSNERANEWLRWRSQTRDFESAELRTSEKKGNKCSFKITYILKIQHYLQIIHNIYIHYLHFFFYLFLISSCTLSSFKSFH